MGKFGPTLIAGLLLISHFMAGPSFAEDQAVLRPMVLIPRAITGLGSYGPIGYRRMYAPEALGPEPAWLAMVTTPCARR